MDADPGSRFLISAVLEGRLMDILLVDDEEHVLKRLGQFLTVRGHRLKTAADGLEALRCAEEAPPDLVICDIQMPGMDGLAFLRAARARFPEMAIVLMTGDRDLDRAIEAFRSGASDYLKKPVDLHKLLACLAKAQAGSHSEMP